MDTSRILGLGVVKKEKEKKKKKRKRALLRFELLLLDSIISFNYTVNHACSWEQILMRVLSHS